jgi:hypothetical protein
MDSVADKEERKREVRLLIYLSYLTRDLQEYSTTVLPNENSVRFPRIFTPLHLDTTDKKLRPPKEGTSQES